MKSVTVFASAVDAWLLAVLYAAPLLFAALGVYLAQADRPDEALTCFVISIGLVLLNLLLTRPCRYTLTADSLNLRCGIFNETIPLSRIESAELSSSWLSGPALSLKRVRIGLDKGSRLVSPTYREVFIAQVMDAAARHQTIKWAKRWGSGSVAVDCRRAFARREESGQCVVKLADPHGERAPSHFHSPWVAKVEFGTRP